MRTWASWILLYFFWSGKHKIQYPKPSIAESLQVQQILLPSLHHVDIDYSDYTRTTQGQPGTAWDNLSSKAWPPPCPLRAWAIEACDCFLWNLAINRSQSISITLVNSSWTHVELMLNSCWTHTKVMLQSSLPCLLHDSFSIVVMLPSQLSCDKFTHFILKGAWTAYILE
jgi:hypothetical protein